MKKLTTILLTTLVGAGIASYAIASEDVKHPRQIKWAFDGMFGHVDKQSAQRGFQVYKEVCAACHGINRVAFRNMAELGFSENEVKALAAGYQIKDGPNDAGDMFERAGKPSDYFPAPYANENQARATHNGAYPPDLSLITKARVDGPNYVYSLLTGFGEVPAYTCGAKNEAGECIQFTAADKGVTGEVFKCIHVKEEEVVAKDGKKSMKQSCTTLGEGQHYNPYFPGGALAMAAPLSDGQVSYEDGTQASVDQMSKDVVTFLQWAAEPEMEARKSMGIKVLIFLAVFTTFMYLAKRNLWRKLH